MDEQVSGLRTRTYLVTWSNQYGRHEELVVRASTPEEARKLAQDNLVRKLVEQNASPDRVTDVRVSVFAAEPCPEATPSTSDVQIALFAEQARRRERDAADAARSEQRAFKDARDTYLRLRSKYEPGIQE